MKGLEKIMIKETIKHRKIIVAKAPSWISREEIKEIKITQIDHVFSSESDFNISYEGAHCTFQHPLTDNEVEAFCEGVESERDRIHNILADYCDEKTLQVIECKLFD